MIKNRGTKKGWNEKEIICKIRKREDGREVKQENHVMYELIHTTVFKGNIRETITPDEILEWSKKYT